MKKFIYSALAAIGLLLSPACSDDNEALSGSGNEALVSFNVNLADGIQTKADPATPTTTLGNGTKATNLVVEVYDANDNDGARVDRKTAPLSGLTGSVTFTLVKGKKYDIIFWAQNETPNTTALEECYYDVSDLRHIKVNYEANGGKSNIEERDAFLWVEDNFTVDGLEHRVELRRPFAQVNFMVPEDDITYANAASFDFEHAGTSVTFKNIPTTLNTLANTVEGDANVTFTAGDIPFKNNTSDLSQANKLSIGGTEYYYLATNYILATAPNAENHALKSATLQITEDGTDNKINVSNMPVQANHRTNIYGNLLTTSSQFNVVINPLFDDLDHGFAETVKVETTDAITEAITNGARTITCSADINSDVEIFIPKVFEAYTVGSDSDSKVVIRFTETIAEGKNVTLVYGSGDKSAPHFIDINANGGNWNHSGLTQSTVTMYGNEINNVISETSENTLIISQGLTVKGYIDAQKGGVQILGKVLGQDSEGSAIIMGAGNTGNLEIQGEVNGNITANNDANITITSTATITGNVEAKGNINVQGSVTGNVSSTGGDATVSIDGSATVGGSVTGKNVEVSTTADVEISNINSGNENANATTFKIGNADELIAFAEKVNDGVTTYEGKTVELTEDIDLNNMFWAPIGANADGANKFKGTFDGQGKTIKNLKVQQGAAYHAAGFFGALNGTAKNFTIDRATITNTSAPNSAGNTDNGTAVVAGSIYPTGTIEGVTVRNATVNGNRYVGGIAGYTQDATIKDCTVESSTITSTPDHLTGSYNNGDKAGGIAGAFWNSTINDCSATNVKIKGYRDLGGIVGFADDKDNVTGYSVSNVTLIQDNTHASEDEAQKTVGAIIGRPGVKDPFDDDYASVVTKIAYIWKTYTVGEKTVTAQKQINAALEYGASQIILTEDVELTSTLQIALGKNVVLNLNSHKINNTTDGVAIWVKGELTINGEGEVYGGSGGNNQAVHAAGGKVIINGGTFSVGPDASNEGNSCIESSGGDIVIYGGKFSSAAKYANKYWVLNLNDAVENKITVYGGSFVNFNPSQTGTEPTGHSDNFVASGYTVSPTTDGENNIIYTVIQQSTGE